MSDDDLANLATAHPTGNAARVARWREEMDEYVEAVKAFAEDPEPDSVMRQISAISARLIEIRIGAVRSESRNVQAFRTKELDPLIDHVELQFKIHSRRLTSLGLDWEMSKGG